VLCIIENFIFYIPIDSYYLNGDRRVRLAVCIVVVVLCGVVILLYYVCIAVFLDVGLLARSQYSEGPVTGHLDTGFSWFPCA